MSGTGRSSCAIRNGKKTLSRERVARRRRDGCGAASRTERIPPLIRRCDGTFPQGKKARRVGGDAHIAPESEG